MTTPMAAMRGHPPVGLTLALAVATSLSACHPGPSEPSPPAALADAASGPSAERHREMHRILERDHRHVIALRVDDRVVLPDDPAFDWRVDFEDPSAFARVYDAGGEAPADAYRVTKAGPFRMMVFGDPKCLKTNPTCGTSKRRWDITVAVK